jgi:hypothetical protein
VAYLHDLPAPYADRLAPARDDGAWEGHCAHRDAERWVAWNVREDAWYRPAELDRVRQTIDATDAANPRLDAAALLRACAAELRLVRGMEPNQGTGTSSGSAGKSRAGTRSGRGAQPWSLLGC